VWKYQEEAQIYRQYWGHTVNGACDTAHAITASHVVCEREDSAEILPLGNHFVVPSDHDEIPLCKILSFTEGRGLPEECKRWECTVDIKMVAMQRSLYTPTPTQCVYVMTITKFN
jgi:hypothetical protein